jgi:hypothetical protein
MGRARTVGVTIPLERKPSEPARTGILDDLRAGERVTFGWSETSKPLHEALSIPETNVRRSVLRLFQGVDAALLRHAEEVDGWMGSVEDRTRERFAGG